MDSHLSGPIVAYWLVRHYQSEAGHPLPAILHFMRKKACALLGLASGEVYIALTVACKAVRSYRTFPPLPLASPKAVYFCCTVSGVASARRYLAPLPRDARTFLMAVTKGNSHAAVQLTHYFAIILIQQCCLCQELPQRFLRQFPLRQGLLLQQLLLRE